MYAYRKDGYVKEMIEFFQERFGLN
jgi:hypothetical protein